MSSISSRWKATLSRFWSKAPESLSQEGETPLIGQEGDVGPQEAPQVADSIIGSAAIRAQSGRRSLSLAQAPHSRLTNAPGQACVQSDHVDFADDDVSAYPRKRHCTVLGATVRNDEVQQKLDSPTCVDVYVAATHGEHEFPGQRPPKIDTGRTRYPKQVSVITQVTPQLHARTLSHLRPNLQPKGTQTVSSTSVPSHLVQPCASTHGAIQQTFVTPPISARKDFMQPYRSSMALTHPSVLSHGKELIADQHRQNGANVHASRMRSPRTARDSRWQHHLQSYHALDATWSQKQAAIEALDAARRQQAEKPTGDTSAGEVVPAGAQLESPILRRALEIVEQVKMDEAERQSKKTMRDIELAAYLSQLHIASDRRQFAVQSLQQSEPGSVEKEPSEEHEVAEQENPSIVDLMSSSDDEDVAATQGTAAHASDAVVEVLSSDDDGAGSEDEEGRTEQSDESMSDEELRIDITHRILTPPLRTEYKRLTRDVPGHDPYVVHPRSRVAVSGEDLKLCGPSQWVGDACINMYMALLQDRDQKWCTRPDSTRPKVLFMNSHFLAKLCQEADGYQYKNVARWTRASRLKLNQLTYTGIKDLDKVVVPVHLGNHWTCAVLNFRNCQIEYYDSLSGVDHLTIDSLLQWVEDEFADKYGGDLPVRFRARTWKKVFNPSGTPQQMNGFDCGIFCMMCCNYTGAGRAFDYDQSDIHSFFRAMCAIECSIMRLRMLDD